MAQNKMAGGKLMHPAEVCGNSAVAPHGPSSIPNFRSSKGSTDAARSSNRGGLTTRTNKSRTGAGKGGY